MAIWRFRDYNINTVKYWDDVYEKLKSPSSAAAYLSVLKLIKEHVGLNPDDAIVDVACGEATGLNAIHGDLGVQCVGLDFSGEIIEHNVETYPHIQFCEFDVRKDPFQKLFGECGLRNRRRVVAMSMHSMEHIDCVEIHLLNFLAHCYMYFLCVPYGDSFSQCTEHINYFNDYTFDEFDVAEKYIHGVNTNLDGLEQSIVYVLKGKA